MPGRFVFITGPMFCGKTEELLKTAKIYRIAGKDVLVCKPKSDDRYISGSVCTHDKVSMSATELSSFNDILPILHNNAGRYSAVFVDEVQFVADVKIETIRLITEGLGIDLFVCGLTLDSFREPFEVSSAILPYAEVKQLVAVCDFCKEFNAEYTYRVSAESTDQVFVGGKESYCASCKTCYMERVNNAEKSESSSET